MQAQAQKETLKRIEKIVQENPLVLFMKGTPESPLCGFSARVVQILNFIETSYQHFNVLSDEDIRQGIKIFGNWPTIPQLYLKGELLGGCDIIQEKFENGTLEKELKNI